jgi:hypothetical protein
MKISPSMSSPKQIEHWNRAGSMPGDHLPGDHLDRYGVFVWYAYAMQRAYAMHAGRAQQKPHKSHTCTRY